MSNNIKIMIFDLDGTLLDTLDDITFSINKVLNNFNLPLINKNECKKMIGEGVETLCARALSYSLIKNKKNINDIDILKLPDENIINEFLKNNNISMNLIVSLMNKYYNKYCFNLTKPYDGILEYLEKITKFRKKNEDFVLSILSNKPDFFVKRMAKRYFKKYNFFPIIGGRKNKPLKPDKNSVYNLIYEIFNNKFFDKYLNEIKFIKFRKNKSKKILIDFENKNIIDKNNKVILNFDQIILIGDSKIDILTSKNSKIKSCFVKWGFGDLDEIKNLGIEPDFIIDKPSELNNLFD